MDAVLLLVVVELVLVDVVVAVLVDERVSVFVRVGVLLLLGGPAAEGVSPCGAGRHPPDRCRASAWVAWPGTSYTLHAVVFLL